MLNTLKNLIVLFFLFGCKENYFSNKKKKDTFSNLLNEEQINEFYENGFIIVRNLLSQDQINEVKELMGEFKAKGDELGSKIFDDKEHEKEQEGTQFILKKSDGKVQIQRIVWVGAMSSRLLEIGRDLKITSIVSQLLNSNKADHLINQLHPKDPNDNVEFGWHQDIENRQSFDSNWQDINGKGSFVQVLTAIDPNNENNGCLFYIPLKEEHKTTLNLKKGQNLDSIENGKKIPFVLEPGDTIFMSPYLIHGSGANNSKDSRILFINGFSSLGANHEPYPGKGSGEEISLVD